MAGAKVVGVARRADAIAELDGVAPISWDLSDRAELPALAEAATAPFGAPDIVVHAAAPRLKISGELRGMKWRSAPNWRPAPKPVPPTPTGSDSASLVPRFGW